QCGKESKSKEMTGDGAVQIQALTEQPWPQNTAERAYAIDERETAGRCLAAQEVSAICPEHAKYGPDSQNGNANSSKLDKRVNGQARSPIAERRHSCAHEEVAFAISGAI